MGVEVYYVKCYPINSPTVLLENYELCLLNLR